VMSGWENGRGLPVVCPPQSFLSQKADGQREISWLFRGFGDTVNLKRFIVAFLFTTSSAYIKFNTDVSR